MKYIQSLSYLSYTQRNQLYEREYKVTKYN